MPNNIIEIIGQVIGFFAIIVAFVSFQAKKRSSILLIQCVSNLIWSAHFFMIGSFAGGIINAYCVLRNIIYSQKDNRIWLNNWLTPTIVSAGSLIISLLSASTLADLLIMPSTIISSIAFYLSDERKIRAFSIFISSSWLVFNIIQFSISGICAELFNLTSITIAIFRFKKFKAMTAEGAQMTFGKSAKSEE